MGKAKGRAKKKKFGNRGPDGRAVPKKPKPAQQNDNSSPGSGDAPVDGADLMEVDEEGTAAANEDANDEEWCDEDSSGANGSSGGGQSILRFAHRSVASAAARAARNAEPKIPKQKKASRTRNEGHGTIHGSILAAGAAGKAATVGAGRGGELLCR
ncbi:unnamed protein product [Pylaiella littoralis]